MPRKRGIKMARPTTTRALNKCLDNAIDEFNAEMQFILDVTNSDETVSRETLEHMASHTFYTFLDFKKHIIQYLESQERRQP